MSIASELGLKSSTSNERHDGELVSLLELLLKIAFLDGLFIDQEHHRARLGPGDVVLGLWPSDLDVVQEVFQRLALKVNPGRFGEIGGVGYGSKEPDFTLHA